jgi:nucleotide-binding universal stress UspA family protein
MKKSEQEIVIRRILVALDASTHSLAALEAAANLAASLHAELIGLYVEDENLLHFAGLPFAQEVRSPTAHRRSIDSDRMEQELRLEASQARHALELAADRVSARWSFRIVRGQVTEVVLAAALEADLLAMGRVGRPLLSRSRLGSTARAASTKTGRSVLLIRDGSDLSYPVLVTYDGSVAARRSLAFAAKLARASGDDLNVLLLANTKEEADLLNKEMSEWLKENNLSARTQWMPLATVANLAKTVQAAENCVLVLGGETPLLRAKALQELLDETDCPVMLVR